MTGHLMLPFSAARRIVLLKNFVNRKDAVSPVIILDQNGDIRNTAHLVPAISKNVSDPVVHQELILSGPGSSYGTVQQLIVTAGPTASKLRNVPSYKLSVNGTFVVIIHFRSVKLHRALQAIRRSGLDERLDKGKQTRFHRDGLRIRPAKYL